MTPCWSSPPTRRRRRRSPGVFASCRKNFPGVVRNANENRSHGTDEPPTPKTKMNPPSLLTEPVAPRDLVSIHDLAPAEILSLFNLTSMLKQRPADFRGTL